MPDTSPPRSEQQIFDELGELCASAGYIHAIAFFSFRDQMVRYSGEMKPQDMQHLFSSSRLIRTEIATLIGLLVKQSIDDTLPDAETIQTMIRRTEELLEELHRSMSIVYRDALKSAQKAGSVSSIFSNAAAMREPIFYSGEAGYGFQYRDFAPPRYARDRDWIIANKSFAIEHASLIARYIGELAQEKLAGDRDAALQKLQSLGFEDFSGQVLEFLDEEHRSQYETPSAWKAMVAQVSKLLVPR